MANQRAAIEFRFYGELNDFLPAARRHRAFDHSLAQRGSELPVRVSIKDAIESLGVPHPEIDLLLVGGRPVDFSYQPLPGDRIAVYPRFRDLDVRGLSIVRPPALDAPRFVLDAHLGRLTAYLRLAGLDCHYSNSAGDEELAAISSTEKRVLLTRDVALLKRSVVEYGHWVRNTDPRRQFGEIADQFALRRHARPFSRCVHCNALLEPVSREAVYDRLPPRTREHYREFHRCPGCARVYWKGGHYERIRKMIHESVVDSSQ